MECVLWANTTGYPVSYAMWIYREHTYEWCSMNSCLYWLVDVKHCHVRHFYFSCELAAAFMWRHLCVFIRKLHILRYLFQFFQRAWLNVREESWIDMNSHAKYAPKTTQFWILSRKNINYNLFGSNIKSIFLFQCWFFVYNLFFFFLVLFHVISLNCKYHIIVSTQIEYNAIPFHVVYSWFSS